MQAVNLLPSEQRPTTSRPGGPRAADAPVGALAVLAVLLVAIVAVALHVQGKNTVKDREAELAQVTAQAAALQAKAQGLQRYQAFQQLAATRQETVGALARGRFEWADTMRDVARVLPSNAFLSTFCADGGSGGCDSGLRGELPNATAITIGGCTSTQTAVAELMTRLRDVRGVTRVTLDSSVSAGQKQGVSVSCPSGDPPTFSIVAFFERSPVATAGQANGTGAATPTPTATPAAGATATATPPGGAATPSATPTASATP